MLNKEQVSLIAPFYNAEEYIERFIKSVLTQTYHNIEFILVNDGSKDNSDFIVKKYENQLKEKFASFVYLKQENGGAASAVNYALKYVNGEYLAWADCDDVMHPDNIKFKYEYLNLHQEVGMVLCGAQSINQETNEIINSLLLAADKRQSNMFETIIFGIPCYPGVFMIRTELLFHKLKNREIYFNSEAGQNYQLLLPVAYDNKCGFIENILYDYYVREDSHSHNADYQKKFKRTYVREVLLDNVLNFMPIDEKNIIMKNIHKESVINRFDLSFANDDKENNQRAYIELKKMRILNCKQKIKYMIINSSVNSLYRKYREIR